MQSESDRLKKQLGQRSGGAIASELAENQDKFFQDEKRLMFLSDIRIPKTGTQLFQDIDENQLLQYKNLQKIMKYQQINSNFLAALERISLFEKDTEFLKNVIGAIHDIDGQVIIQSDINQDSGGEPAEERAVVAEVEAPNHSGNLRSTQSLLSSQLEQLVQQSISDKTNVYDFWIDKLKSAKSQAGSKFQNLKQKREEIKNGTDVLKALNYQIQAQSTTSSRQWKSIYNSQSQRKSSGQLPEIKQMKTAYQSMYPPTSGKSSFSFKETGFSNKSHQRGKSQPKLFL